MVRLCMLQTGNLISNVSLNQFRNYFCSYDCTRTAVFEPCMNVRMTVHEDCSVRAQHECSYDCSRRLQCSSPAWMFVWLFTQTAVFEPSINVLMTVHEDCSVRAQHECSYDCSRRLQCLSPEWMFLWLFTQTAVFEPSMNAWFSVRCNVITPQCHCTAPLCMMPLLDRLSSSSLYISSFR